jgi:hypothetical protein
MRNWLKSCLTCFNIAIALRLAFEAVMGQAVVATTITANGCTITDAAANRDRVLMIKGMMAGVWMVVEANNGRAHDGQSAGFARQLP